MKLLVPVILLISVSVHAVEPDKELHAVSSYALSTTIYSSLRSNTKLHKSTALLSAAAATLLLGYAKERRDAQFDVGDMNANAVGATAGFIIPITFNF
jgi:hypothetical protein